MPLAFNSISHGQVVFGFFNIESDMLLLENNFFFSTTFCAVISQLAEDNDRSAPVSFPGVTINQPGDIGDLMGAIHGIRHTGFIGALYRHFPFPENPADFKQNPEGTASHELVKTLIAGYGQDVKIPFLQDRDGAEITIGGYRFDRTSFHQLLDYVWKGGLPQWKDESPPLYVMRMKAAVLESRNPIFLDMAFAE